jgi:hypothetical protein
MIIPRAETREGASGKQARVERVGRNGPCPCNSGKKYKHCWQFDFEQQEAERLSKTKGLDEEAFPPWARNRGQRSWSHRYSADLDQPPS